MNPNPPAPFEPTTIELPPAAAEEIRAAVAALKADEAFTTAASPPDWPASTGDVIEDLRLVMAKMEAAGLTPSVRDAITERHAQQLMSLADRLRVKDDPVTDWPRFIFGGPIARAGGIVRIDDPPPRQQPRRAAGRSVAPHRGREAIVPTRTSHKAEGQWLVQNKTNRKMRRAKAAR